MSLGLIVKPPSKRTRMKRHRPRDPEYEKIVRYFRIVIAVSIVVISVGTIFYHLVEKLSWIDSVYFCSMTLATVGYGDITPHTNAGKIFTIFYVFTGVGIIGALVNLTLRRAVAGRHYK